MAKADVFALKNSGLEAFLLAEVGTEWNGSGLTVLSLLARLGKDPWAEAATWSKLPRALRIDRLADSIGQMPLRPEALRDARETAARLVQLLPGQPAATPAPTHPLWSRLWQPLIILYCALAFGMAVTAVLAAHSP
jgi:hypothetical protein